MRNLSDHFSSTSYNRFPGLRILGGARSRPWDLSWRDGLTAMTGADEPDDRGADRAAKPERPECQRAYEAYAAGLTSLPSLPQKNCKSKQRLSEVCNFTTHTTIHNILELSVCTSLSVAKQGAKVAKGSKTAQNKKGSSPCELWLSFRIVPDIVEVTKYHHTAFRSRKGPSNRYTVSTHHMMMWW